MVDQFEGIQPEDGELCLAFHTLHDIPEGLAQRVGPFVFTLNLTETGIKSLRNLVYFSHLKTLILDNNGLRNLGECPVLDSVTTLWLNNNQISDLPSFLDSIIICFPNLYYLSMMRNPASFDPSVPDVKSWKLYRLYTLYRMPGLTTLDFTVVTEEERIDAQARGLFAIKRRPVNHHHVAAASGHAKPAASRHAVEEEQGDTPLSSTSSPTIERKRGALLGIVRRRYDGRHSEGNRFIVDSQL